MFTFSFIADQVTFGQSGAWKTVLYIALCTLKCITSYCSIFKTESRTVQLMVVRRGQRQALMLSV